MSCCLRRQRDYNRAADTIRPEPTREQHNYIQSNLYRDEWFNLISEDGYRALAARAEGEPPRRRRRLNPPEEPEQGLFLFFVFALIVSLLVPEPSAPAAEPGAAPESVAVACTICQDTEDGLLVPFGPCAHNFHQVCLDGLRASGRTYRCPNCRSPPSSPSSLGSLVDRAEGLEVGEEDGFDVVYELEDEAVV